MPNIETVIKGLEEVIAEAVYPDRPRKFMMPLELAEDALALLKAQEPSAVHITAKINNRKIGTCPNCGKLINSGDYPNYCGHCGQAVKWG